MARRNISTVPVFFIPLFLFTSTIWAQILYTNQGLVNNHFCDISIENNTGNYIVLNQNVDFSQNVNASKNYILKISPIGNLLSTTLIDSNFINFCPLLYHAGNYYYTGVRRKFYSFNDYSTMLIAVKLDQNFNILSKLTLDSAYNESISPRTLVARNNRLYVTYCKVASQSTIKIYKTDLNFFKLDSASFGGPGYASGCSIEHIQNHGDGFLMVGGGFPQGSA